MIIVSIILAVRVTLLRKKRKKKIAKYLGPAIYDIATGVAVPIKQQKLPGQWMTLDDPGCSTALTAWFTLYGCLRNRKAQFSNLIFENCKPTKVWVKLSPKKKSEDDDLPRPVISIGPFHILFPKNKDWCIFGNNFETYHSKLAWEPKRWTVNKTKILKIFPFIRSKSHRNYFHQTSRAYFSKLFAEVFFAVASVLESFLSYDHYPGLPEVTMSRFRGVLIKLI